MIITKKTTLGFCCILLTTIFNTNIAVSASNEPILVSNANITGIERFGIDRNNQFIVFNEFDQNGVLNRFSRDISEPTNTLNTLRTGLSRVEETFVFDTDDSLILSIDESNGGLSKTSFDGQSNIQLSAPNNELPNLFSGQISNTDFNVFRTTNGNLYSIKSDGLSPATLLSSGFDVDRFRVTRDRQNVIFSADTFSNNQLIFSTSIDGSSGLTLIHELPESSDIDSSMIVSVDNSRVIYIVETFLDNNVETLQLYSTPIDGSSPPSQLGSPVTGTSSDIDFELSDDGRFVAFLLEESVFGATGAFDILLTAPIDGSDFATVIDISTNIIDFDITNNSQTILYSSEISTPNPFIFTFELLSSPFDASTSPVSIAPNDTDVFDIGTRDFQASDDSKFVFYSALDTSTQSTKLYRSNADGSGGSIQVSANIPTVSNAEVGQFEVDSINSRVIYSTSDSGVTSNELFSVNFDGTGHSTLVSVNAVIDNLDLSSSRDFVSYITTPFFENTESPALFVLDISIKPEAFCFPIKAQNGSFVTICL